MAQERERGGEMERDTGNREVAGTWTERERQTNRKRQRRKTKEESRMEDAHLLPRRA